MGTLAYALQVTQSPDIKITKSTLSKTTLSIGDIHLRPDESIQIMVKTGKATATVRPPSLKKFAMRTDGSGGPKESQHQPQPSKPTMPSLGDVAPLEMRTQYVVKESDDIDDPKANKPIRDFDDEDEEDVSKDTFQDSQRVEKEDLTRAYKYGSTWIPIEDESADRLSTVKGLEVIGFSYEDLVRFPISLMDPYPMVPHSGRGNGLWAKSITSLQTTKFPVPKLLSPRSFVRWGATK